MNGNMLGFLRLGRVEVIFRPFLIGVESRGLAHGNVSRPCNKRISSGPAYPFYGGGESRQNRRACGRGQKPKLWLTLVRALFSCERGLRY